MLTTMLELSELMHATLKGNNPKVRESSCALTDCVYSNRVLITFFTAVLCWSHFLEVILATLKGNSSKVRKARELKRYLLIMLFLRELPRVEESTCALTLS